MPFLNLLDSLNPSTLTVILASFVAGTLVIFIGFRPRYSGKLVSRLFCLGSMAQDSLASLSTAACGLTSGQLSLCHVCNKSGNLRCSRCKSVKYCSADCQRQHWHNGHKRQCCHLASLSRPESSPGSRPTSPDLAELSLGLPLSTEGHRTLPKRILFPYYDFLRYFTWKEIPGPPSGLLNYGNSCYANAVLQCLTHTRPLAAYLLEGNHSETCVKSGGCILCAMEAHVERALGLSEDSKPFLANQIIRIIQNRLQTLGYDRQEDAHEFIRFTIDSMQAMCLEEFGGEKKVDAATQETTVMHHIFGGVLRSQVQCTVCQHESARYESIMDLAVEVQGNIATLEGSLAQFTATEWLDGDNKYKCDKCNTYVKAGKRLVIHEAPNILTVALKRFQAGRFGKLNKKVTFPANLDLGPYMSAAAMATGQRATYSLYAVIVHYDLRNSSFFGHYTCYVRGGRDKWYEIDDAEVLDATLEEVLQQKAYLLFYSRDEPREAPAVAGGAAGSTATSPSDPNVADVAVSQASENDSSLGGSSSTGEGSREASEKFHEREPISTPNGVEGRAPQESDSRATTGLVPSSPSEGSSPQNQQGSAPVKKAKIGSPEGPLSKPEEGTQMETSGGKRMVEELGSSEDGSAKVGDGYGEDAVAGVVKLTTANLSGSSDEEDKVTSLLKRDKQKGDGGDGGRGNKVKQGRNEACACGSKRKWKRCCGAKQV